MQQKSNSYLETEKVGILMRRYALPCVVSLLVAALYNIVDQMFIANAAYLGSNGNAANTAVFPLTVIALSIAVMLGDGCCAFVSISLGSGKKQDAHYAVGNAIILCIVASVLLSAVYLLFPEWILRIFGAGINAETFAYARQYFFYIALGIPLYMFGQMLNPVIRSDGSPRFAMCSTLAGALCNLILDPLFIFAFHWGMMGAAIATVAGQALTAAMELWYLFHMKTLRLERGSFRLYGKLIRRFVCLGLCSFLAQISLVAAMAAINNMLRKYSASDPVFSQPQYAQIPMAVVGIVMKFFQIIISVSIGMAAGCIPVVGYNVAAGRGDRAKKLLNILLVSQVMLGLASLIVVECFPGSLIAFFGAGNESFYYTQFAEKSFRIYLCMTVLACVNKAAFIYLQSLGKAAASAFLSMIREIVFGVGFAVILPEFFGLDGVLYSMPASDILTFFISSFILYKTYKKLDMCTTGCVKSPARE